MQVWVVARLGSWAAEPETQLIHVAASKELARSWALSQFLRAEVEKEDVLFDEREGDLVLVCRSWEDPDNPESKVWSIECHEVEE